MLDRHAVQALRRAKVTAHAIATQFGVSIRTVRCLLREEAVDTRDDVAALAPAFFEVTEQEDRDAECFENRPGEWRDGESAFGIPCAGFRNIRTEIGGSPPRILHGATEPEE